MTRMGNNSTQAMVQQLLSHLRADSRSSSEIARLASVSQPTVWRMRRSYEKRQRISKSFNKLCALYGVSLAAPDKAIHRYDELLRNAIIDVWDGTEASGRALLLVIKGLKGLNRKTDGIAGDSLDHT